MVNSSWRFAIGLSVALAAVSGLPACSKPAAKPADASADAGPSSPDDPTAANAAAAGAETGIAIEAKPSAVVVDNRVGRRLISVRIAIDVAESPTPFVLVVPTIEADAKAEFELTKFLSDDATMLDPTAMHPKQVNIKTHDSFGRPHEVTLPWAP